MPALIVGTQVLGEPRYPSLKGIMAARSKEVVTQSLADLGVDDGRVGGGGRDDEGHRPPSRRRRGPRRASCAARPRRPPARSSTSSPTRRLI